MKCRSCDCILTDLEASKKYYGTTDQYIELCSSCFSEVKDDFLYEYSFEEVEGVAVDLEEIENE